MLTFQEVILRLQRYWADQGALIWLPYSEKVGAGTMNPATILRVLGPEPWNVGYAEPSFRPDDGRYAENPNRMQMHTQFQVILKPDPGDPQERYLRSLEALGIRREEHDIRFVEDNWESPALGAWGLGWEVWLDGLEITQFTYFQQAGGINLDVPAVEITYGLERIVMYLQGVRSVWEMAWDDDHTYGEILADQEVDYCRYEFELADIKQLQSMYQIFEDEALRCLDAGLAVPALDYILRCSHTFNLLDSRGAVGVTERATFFKRMRGLARRASDAYLVQRERAGYPWLERSRLSKGAQVQGAPMHLPWRDQEKCAPEFAPGERVPFLFEIGTEELPATHLSMALEQLHRLVPQALDEARLEHGDIHIWGTPRRLAIFVENLICRQPDEERLVKGPPARIAFDAEGNPSRAAQGFARSQGVDLAALRVEEIDGGEYVTAIKHEAGRPALEVLPEVLTGWITGLRFPRSMRWNGDGVAFSRPIRWLVALLDETVVSFGYAGLKSERVTRGPRPAGSPEVALASALDYMTTLETYGVIVDPEKRSAEVVRQAQALAVEVGGQIPDDAGLLEEVTNLVEVCTAVRGSFEEHYLSLPQEVLIAVMKKHQRYFPVLDSRGRIMPYFITVRNGGSEYSDIVRQGNADVIRARYADAEFFYKQDSRQSLETFLPHLSTLTFQEDLGSMLDKSHRITDLAPWVGMRLGLSKLDLDILGRAAYLCKADLVTKMVVEMTSLQGIMGREYALRSGEAAEVARAIYEHYLPRYANDALPKTLPGVALALSDRLDSLAGLFAAGLEPTGSADPYGLRRAALGIVLILLEHKLSFSVREGLKEASRSLPVKVDPDKLDTALVFVVGRLQGVLRDMGLAYDVVEAALAERGDNPLLAYAAAEQLSVWVAREDWSTILDNYARCVRITRDQEPYTLVAEHLKEETELVLYKALVDAESKLGVQSNVDDLLNVFLPLVPIIEKFFVDIMVMVDDEQLRTARLALLQRVAGLAAGIVDLSKLEGF
ncbi:MAG: glycine--tRNA ligase subunit beta [Anaerolineae bacterium]|nr:glycine--tRNA ligase subunit beta [Anaerolineae bacterium]